MKGELEESFDLLEEVDEKDIYVNIKAVKSNQSILLTGIGLVIASLAVLEMGLHPAVIFILGLGISVIGVVTNKSGTHGGKWNKLYEGLRNDIEKIDKGSPPLYYLVEANNLMDKGDSE